MLKKKLVVKITKISAIIKKIEIERKIGFIRKRSISKPTVNCAHPASIYIPNAKKLIEVAVSPIVNVPWALPAEDETKTGGLARERELPLLSLSVSTNESPVRSYPPVFLIVIV